MKPFPREASSAKYRLALRCALLISFTTSFFLFYIPHSGWTGEDKAIHLPGSVAHERTLIGLDEKLGQRIPLDLEFTNEDFRPVVLGDLIKVPTIIVPVYYHCPNVCSFLLGGLALALPKVALTPGEDFLVISISFDENETSTLAQKTKENYLTAMDNQFPANAWLFLTGDRPNIHKFTDSIGYQFQKQGEDFIHPVAVVVVAPDGKIVRYLYGTSFLPMDLTLALLEASQGKVGASIKKVLNFCFSYDPETKRYVFNILRVSATVILLTAGSFLAFLLVTGRKKKEE